MNNKEIPFNNKYIKNNMLSLLENCDSDKNKPLFRFCSNDYANYGSHYTFDEDMTVDKVLRLIGDNQIRTRVSKSKDVQKRRTTEKAEVFTPRWVCEYQVNQCIIGETGLTKEELSNRVNEYIFCEDWNIRPNVHPVLELKKRSNDKKDYYSFINRRWLESCCGEAPYVVSRYDTVSGEDISVENRIGFLDRKLQLIGRYKNTFTEWFLDVIKAYKSIFAYEWQGDNLFIARCNLLMTFFDYYEAKFNDSIENLSSEDIEKTLDVFNAKCNKEPAISNSIDGIVEKIVEVITKNTTQMDGLTWKKPGTEKDAYLVDWTELTNGHTAYMSYEKVFNDIKKEEDKKKKEEADRKAREEEGYDTWLFDTDNTTEE